MITAGLLDKTLAPQVRSVGSYSAPQYLAPWELADLTANVVFYVLNELSEGGRIQEVSGAPPATFGDLVGRTILIDLGIDLLGEGYEIGAGIQILLWPDPANTVPVTYRGELIDIQGTAARIRLDGVISSAVYPAFTPQVQRAAVFQEFFL